MPLMLSEQLMRYFEALPGEKQRTLLDFAEFLARRQAPPSGLLEESSEKMPAIPLPKSLLAPENESVVAALKRLRQSYFMLDATQLLGEAAALVSEYVMKGRPTEEVILELEKCFEKRYRLFCEHAQGASNDQPS
jgi:hypothetical protein